MRTQGSRMELRFVFIRKQPLLQVFQSYPGLLLNDTVMMPYCTFRVRIIPQVTTDYVIQQRIAYLAE